MIPAKFDDIRPYYPHEVAEAMQRVADSPELAAAARFVFPGEETESVRRMIRSIGSAEEFQDKVMSRAIERIVGSSMTGFTYEGLGHVVAGQGRLFVSNHRDIMLDASLLQYVLHAHGLETTDITFGDNLMYPGFVTDVGRSNKMFKVVRGANIKELLSHSKLLSEYMRMAVAELSHSVWIAQRNGRTKDGRDATDQGLVKMFGMSGDGDMAESFARLNITPVAISYQYEPCDMFKVQELFASRGGRKYVKAPGEDLRSIVTGIMQPKGMVHMAVCRPIGLSELEPLRMLERNEFYRALASLIDRRIFAAYRLFDTNYAAHDIRSGENRWSDRYSPQFREEFEAYAEGIISRLDGERETLRDILLGIYANPVDNCAGSASVRLD